MTKQNYILSLLMVILFSLTAQAQTDKQKTYYRYFTVEVENITQAEFTKLSSSRDNSYLKFNNVCASTSLVLVMYDASIAKRIDDMKFEISEMLSTQFPSREISKVKTVAYSDKSNFCK